MCLWYKFKNKLLSYTQIDYPCLWIVSITLLIVRMPHNHAYSCIVTTCALFFLDILSFSCMCTQELLRKALMFSHARLYCVYISKTFIHASTDIVCTVTRSHACHLKAIRTCTQYFVCSYMHSFRNCKWLGTNIIYKIYLTMLII